MAPASAVMVTQAELLRLIEDYASKKALHSFLEATRVATDRRDRGPARSELAAQTEMRDLRAQLQQVVDTLPIEKGPQS